MNTENTTASQPTPEVLALLAELTDLGPANYDALLEFHDYTPEDIERAAATGLVRVFEEDGERGVELTDAGTARLGRG